MSAEFTPAFVAVLVVVTVGFLLGMLVEWHIERAKPGQPDPSRMTFHRPAPHVLVVEVRSPASADQCVQLREMLLKSEPDATQVIVVALDPDGRVPL